MKVMVVGGGGREHAIIKKIKESPRVDTIYALPGNGGIAADATCVDIGAEDLPAIVDFAVSNKIDFAVVAPDDPLVMSGTFEDIDVPPTLISFAVTTDRAGSIITPEFKKADDKCIMLTPEYGVDELPAGDSLKKLYSTVNQLNEAGLIKAAYTPGFGGPAESVMKMAMGNGLGFSFNKALSMDDIFGYRYGAFILEVEPSLELEGDNVTELGVITSGNSIDWGSFSVEMKDLVDAYESKLEPVYKCNIKTEPNKIETFTYRSETRSHAHSQRR